MTLSESTVCSFQLDYATNTITVAGELDLAARDHLTALAETAFSGTESTLRIDLAGVTFMDSCGISALVAIRNLSETGQHTLVLQQPSARVLRVLDLTGLTAVFTIT